MDLLYNKDINILCNVVLFYQGQRVYDENLPFRDEPEDEDIKDFINFIRPNLKFDYIIFSYVRDLGPKER